MDNPFEMKPGMMECSHCNGYGSSLKDDWDQRLCTVCDGSGLVKSPPEMLSDDGFEKALLDYLRG